jgi:hypothetical protein
MQPSSILKKRGQLKGVNNKLKKASIIEAALIQLGAIPYLLLNRCIIYS